MAQAVVTVDHPFMNGNKPIPLEVVHEQASYIPISKVKEWLVGWDVPDADKEAVIHRRSDIRIYMKQFFAEPEEILDLMRNCGVILSGSRAQEFFTPETSTSSSDLDFFCTTDGTRMPGPKDVFMHHMSTIGVLWGDADDDAANNQIDPGDEYTALGFTLIKGSLRSKGKDWKIQLIDAGGHDGGSAHSNIFKFHSTVTQCFISGFGGVSLYDEYTSNYEIVHWPQNDPNVMKLLPHRYVTRRSTFEFNLAPWEPSAPPINDSDRSHHVVQSIDPEKIKRKFTGRGFTFVKYGSRGPTAHGSVKDLGSYGLKQRSICQPGVLKVSFEPYLETEKWETPFKTYWNSLDYITWREKHDGTVATPGALENLDFSFERDYDGDAFDTQWEGSNKVFNINGQGYWSDEWWKHMWETKRWPDDGRFYGRKEVMDKYSANIRARYPC